MDPCYRPEVGRMSLHRAVPPMPTFKPCRIFIFPRLTKREHRLYRRQGFRWLRELETEQTLRHPLSRPKALKSPRSPLILGMRGFLEREQGTGFIATRKAAIRSSTASTPTFPTRRLMPRARTVLRKGSFRALILTRREPSKEPSQ